MSLRVTGERKRSGGAGTAVTFLGRGLATRLGGRFVLHVCPLCSQRNGRRGAERGVCEWCAYEPAPCDMQPVDAVERAA